MNIGTKVRTIAAFLIFINLCLMVFGVISFENSTIAMIYRIISIIAVGVSWAFSHYNNNDFSEAATEGTGLTRFIKAEKKGVYGENFFDIPEELEDESEKEGEEKDA